VATHLLGGTGEVAAVAFAVTSLLLAGLAWVVQIVVYPGFAQAGPSPTWPAVHAAHTRRLAAVITLPWVLEGLSAAALLVRRPAGVPLVLVLVGDACAAVTVAVTVLVSVPAHQRLAIAYDPTVQRRLVRTTWLRTVAWSGAAACGVALLVR